MNLGSSDYGYIEVEKNVDFEITLKCLFEKKKHRIEMRLISYGYFKNDIQKLMNISRRTMYRDISEIQNILENNEELI